MNKTTDRELHADLMASRYLAQFNELDERGLGHTKKAQEIYRKADMWLARLNRILGNA